MAVAETSTDENGDFTTPAVPPGDYLLQTSNDAGYINRLNDGTECVGWLCGERGMPVTGMPGSTTTGVNFALRPGGRIAGQVADAPGNVDVEIFDAAGRMVSKGLTDGFGQDLTGDGLLTGTYYAQTRNYAGFIDQGYHDEGCGVGCPVTAGARIDVVTGNPASGFDFDLEPGGRIAGKVADGTGRPLPGVLIQIHDAYGRRVGQAYTDSFGVYRTGAGLQPGTYYARTFAQPNSNPQPAFVDRMYGGAPCLGYFETCLVTDGKPIVVSGTAITGGIDFTLTPGARISGRVTSGGHGVPFVTLRVYDEAAVVLGEIRADENGRYISSFALPPGTFFIRTHHPTLGNKAWGNFGCAPCDVTDSAPIIVSPAAPTALFSNINFVLPEGGGIAGVVRYSSGEFAAGVPVEIIDAEGGVASLVITAGDGSYRSESIFPGTYVVRTANTLGHHDALYDAMPCTPEMCDPLEDGTPIEVMNDVVTEVDLQLGDLIAEPDHHLEAPEAAPVTADDDDSAVRRPLLAWTQVPGATGYEIQVNDTPDEVTPLMQVQVPAPRVDRSMPIGMGKEPVVCTSGQPDELDRGVVSAVTLPPGVTYFRVRAINREGPGPWSEMGQFTARDFSIDPVSWEVEASGGTDTVKVNATEYAGAWTATKSADATWVTFSKPGGVGDGTIVVTVAPYTTSVLPRQPISVTIAGRPFFITQAGATPTYSVTPATLSYTNAAAAKTFNLTVAPANADWTVESNQPWLTLNTAGGTGNRVITATVSAYVTSVVPRTATISIKRGAVVVRTVAVTQTSMTPVFTLAPTTWSVGAAGGTQVATLGTTPPDAPWTATSTQSWVTFSATSGNGPAAIALTAAPYTTSTLPRTATVTIGGKTLLVRQAGATAVLTLTPPLWNVGAAGGTQPVTLTAVPNTAAWAAQSSAPWLVTNKPSGIGGTAMTLTAQPHTTSVSPRLASLRVGSIWQALTAMPTPRGQAGAGAINGLVYVAGGVAGGVHQSVLQVYNPVTNSWTNLVVAGNQVQTAPASAVALGKLYLAGGATAGGPVATTRAYDPVANSWTLLADMPAPRTQVAGGVIANVLYVVGGTEIGGIVSPLNQAYDIATNTWSTKAPLPEARTALAAAVLGDTLYVIGGANGAGAMQATLYAYDPIADAWQTRAAMPTARGHLTAQAIDGKLVVVGGSTASTVHGSAVVEVYDPATDTWSPGTPLPAGRSAGATVFVNGTLYVLGGFVGPGPTFVATNVAHGLPYIADQTVHVTQAGATPTYTVAPVAVTFLPAGGTAPVTLTATPTDAPWTATSSEGWLTVSHGLRHGEQGADADRDPVDAGGNPHGDGQHRRKDRRRGATGHGQRAHRDREERGRRALAARLR